MFDPQGVQAETYIESTMRQPRQYARVAGPMLVLCVLSALVAVGAALLGEWLVAIFAAVCAVACVDFRRFAGRAARAKLSAGKDLAEQGAQRRAEREAALDARITEAKASGAFDRFGPDNGSST